MIKNALAEEEVQPTYLFRISLNSNLKDEINYIHCFSFETMDSLKELLNSYFLFVNSYFLLIKIQEKIYYNQFAWNAF